MFTVIPLLFLLLIILNQYIIYILKYYINSLLLIIKLLFINFNNFINNVYVLMTW